MPPNRQLSEFFTEENWLFGTVLSTRSVLWASNMTKMRWRPGLRPGPRWGSSRRFSRFPSRLGRGTPLPIPTSLGAFSVSNLAPSAFSFCASPGYASVNISINLLQVAWIISKSELFLFDCCSILGLMIAGQTTHSTLEHRTVSVAPV